MTAIPPPLHRVSLRLAARLLLLLVLTGAFLAGCDGTAMEEAAPHARLEDPVTVPFFMENAEGEAPTAPDEPVYENRKHTPVTAPDGRHLTLRELSTVQGTAEVTCIQGGTRVALTLRGLIPNGVYTIWNVTFHDPGMDPSKEMLNIRGVGALGPRNGSQSAFVASAEGHATIAGVTPPGPLSMIGDIAPCALTDEVEYHIIGSYHLDGKTYGPDLGPDGSALEQFAFVYVPQ